MSTCGRCGHPGTAHEGGSPDETEILLTRLRCQGYAVSRAAVATTRNETRTPAHTPLCHRCGRQGHETKDCTA